MHICINMRTKLWLKTGSLVHQFVSTDKTKSREYIIKFEHEHRDYEGNFMDLHLIYEETSFNNEKYIVMLNMVRIYAGSKSWWI
jgi:hypothetical protein